MKEKIKEDLDLLKRWQLIDMIVDMEKTIRKYENKALKTKLEKFLRKYCWTNSDMVEENGIGIGYVNEEDKPKVVKEVDELFELLGDE